MDKFILETKNLTKSFGKQKAVNNISLRIKENSIYGLLGPNGAGKSTTLKMISRMIHKHLVKSFFKVMSGVVTIYRILVP